MKQLLQLIAVVALVGCGSSSEKQPTDNNASNNVNNTARAAKKPNQPAARPKPQWPPKFDVTADAYAAIPDAVEALVSAAESGDDQTRAKAMGWLAMQGSAAVQPLADRLNKGAGRATEIAICFALGCIDDSAVPALIEVLKNSDDRLVRVNAAKYLGLVPTKQAAVVEQKVKVLVDVMRNHDDETTRVHSIKALTQIGPPAQALAQAPLQAILDDRSQSNAIRDAAGKAIKSVAPRKTLVER